MTMCDLDGGVGRLSRAFKDLKERLAEVKSQWNDASLQQFEETYLRDLPPRMQLLVTAIGRLSETIAQAERDCADERAE